MEVKNTVEYVTRYIETMVLQDLQRKMVFIGGPRQCGKTTMAKSLHRQDETNPDSRYLNWDSQDYDETVFCAPIEFVSEMTGALRY